jgi:hypothetical protein
MNMLRVNSLSFVVSLSLDCSTPKTSFRCFLAVKHASSAMLRTNPSKGKDTSGGSIILTASGVYISCSDSAFSLYFPQQVAGVRSGGGPVDCELLLVQVNDRYLTLTQTAPARPRELLIDDLSVAFMNASPSGSIPLPILQRINFNKQIFVSIRFVRD